VLQDIYTKRCAFFLRNESERTNNIPCIGHLPPKDVLLIGFGMFMRDAARVLRWKALIHFLIAFLSMVADNYQGFGQA
jgi:hypothetical protein